MTEEENVETPGVLGSDPAPETTEPQETSEQPITELAAVAGDPR